MEAKLKSVPSNLPGTLYPRPLLRVQGRPTSLAFSGVPLGEGEAGEEGSQRSRSQSRSRWISLLLGSFRVLLSSLMLAWCFSKTSSGLSKN